MALLVHGGHVLNASYTALERADILIEADRIQAVGQGLEVPPEAQRLDAAGCLVIPGLINAHTQAQAAADRLRTQNQAAWTLAEQFAPYVSTACRAAVATPYPVQRYAAS